MAATRIAPEALEARATARFIRVSPTKARQVVDLIRGRHIEDARRVLTFTPRGPSPVVKKILDSAVANAEHNRGLDAEELVVTRAWVDEGPTLRRFRPRALGRATRIRKRTCHISVVVGRAEDLVPEAPAAESETAAEKSSPKKTAAQKSTAKKSTAKKSTDKKSSAKKSSAKKSTAKKSSAKKSTAKKSTAKKSGEE